MFDRSVCTGDESEINDSLESFPSGHSTAAGAGFVYLSLYLNAMLKVMSDHHPACVFILASCRLWKPVLTRARPPRSSTATGSVRPRLRLSNPRLSTDSHALCALLDVLVFAPLLGAALIAGSLTIDKVRPPPRAQQPMRSELTRVATSVPPHTRRHRKSPILPAVSRTAR
jgi:hypothetical protein